MFSDSAGEEVGRHNEANGGSNRSRSPGGNGGSVKTLQSWCQGFNGEEDRAVAENILAQLDDCRKNEGVSDQQTLTTAACLFVDNAGYWYRVKRTEVHSWGELIRAFRHRYIGEVRQRDVQIDLLRRTQGVEETMTASIDCFKYIISHLERPPPMEELVETAY